MLDAVLSLLGTIIYPLFSILFVLIDLIQGIFYGFAGIGSVRVTSGSSTSSWGTGGEVISGTGNTGDLNDSGIVYYMLNSPIVRNLVISLTVLALVLLVIFTGLAFVKNMYSEKPKSWKNIVGSSLKGLVSFIMTPLICCLGALAGNILLRAINDATSGSTGNASMARMVFISASYDANRFRSGGADDSLRQWVREQYKNLTGVEIAEDASNDRYAEVLDEIYKSESGPSIKSWGSVNKGYNIMSINYLILIVGCVFMLYALGGLSFGMVKRLFMLTFTFVLSPIMASLYPIDDGKAAKGMMSTFYKQFLSAYSAVVGLNLFFSILPFFQNLRIANDFINITDAVFFNIFSLAMLICGLFVVKDLMSLISSNIGADDAYSAGTALMKSTQGKLKNTFKKTAAATAFTVGAFSRVHQARKDAASEGAGFWSGKRFTAGLSAFTGVGRGEDGKIHVDKDGLTGKIAQGIGNLSGLDLIASTGEVRKALGDANDKQEGLDKSNKKFKEAQVAAKDTTSNQYATSISYDSKGKVVSANVADNGYENLAALIKKISGVKDEKTQESLWKEALKHNSSTGIEGILYTLGLDKSKKFADVKETAATNTSLTKYMGDYKGARDAYNPIASIDRLNVETLDAKTGEGMFVAKNGQMKTYDSSMQAKLDTAGISREQYENMAAAANAHAKGFAGYKEDARVYAEAMAQALDRFLKANEFKVADNEKLSQAFQKASKEMVGALNELKPMSEAEKAEIVKLRKLLEDEQKKNAKNNNNNGGKNGKK